MQRERGREHTICGLHKQLSLSISTNRLSHAPFLASPFIPPPYDNQLSRWRWSIINKCQSKSNQVIFRVCVFFFLTFKRKEKKKFICFSVFLHLTWNIYRRWAFTQKNEHLGMCLFLCYFFFLLYPDKSVERVSFIDRTTNSFFAFHDG